MLDENDLQSGFDEEMFPDEQADDRAFRLESLESYPDSQPFELTESETLPSDEPDASVQEQTADSPEASGSDEAGDTPADAGNDPMTPQTEGDPQATSESVDQDAEQLSSEEPNDENDGEEAELLKVIKNKDDLEPDFRNLFGALTLTEEHKPTDVGELQDNIAVEPDPDSKPLFDDDWQMEPPLPRKRGRKYVRIITLALVACLIGAAFYFAESVRLRCSLCHRNPIFVGLFDHYILKKHSNWNNWTDSTSTSGPWQQETSSTSHRSGNDHESHEHGSHGQASPGTVTDSEGHGSPDSHETHASPEGVHAPASHQQAPEAHVSDALPKKNTPAVTQELSVHHDAVVAKKEQAAPPKQARTEQRPSATVDDGAAEYARLIRRLAASKEASKRATKPASPITPKPTSTTSSGTTSASTVNKPKGPEISATPDPSVPAPIVELKVADIVVKKATRSTPQFVVHVCVTNQRREAESWLERLQRRQVPNCFISEQQVRGKVQYNIRFGNYSSKFDAETARLRYGIRTGTVCRLR